jgi:surfeit locus 1 family protein
LSKLAFSWKWFFLTLGVLAAAAVCIRLGLWQLDRLAERRAFNARVEAQVQAAPLELNKQVPSAVQLYDMEYRSVTVTGIYDPSQELLLDNKVNGNQMGYQVFTPLRIAGSNSAVLVERGWIPPQDAAPDVRQKYAEPGQVTVQGILRRSQDKPGFGGLFNPTRVSGAAPLDTWNYISIPQIQEQLPYPILTLYIQEAPNPGWTGMPVRQMDAPEITEGPHMSYAIQWFFFAALLGIGFPVFLVWRRRKHPGNQEKSVEKVDQAISRVEIR